MKTNQYLLQKAKIDGVTPAKPVLSEVEGAEDPERKSWIPASAGMTNTVSATRTN